MRMGGVVLRNTYKSDIHSYFPLFLFLCLFLWISIGLFFPLDASAALPDAVDDSAEVEEDGSVSIDVMSGDDPGDVPATISILSAPANGTAVVNDQGTAGDPSDDVIDYTPAADFAGTDGFT